MRCSPAHGPRVLAALVLAATPLWLAMARTGEGGAWPNDWPVELEDVRAQATTTRWDRTPGELLYQIPFESREQFEVAWPGILRAKSRGGTLTLYRVGSPGEGWPGVSNEGPAVRILAPSGGYSALTERQRGPQPQTLDDMEALVEQGNALHADEPWPESAFLPNGDLAEYVTIEFVDGRMTWVAAGQDDGRLRDLHRARVDIVLVVDGQVIDLNRIRLPADTKVIDKRGLTGSDG